MTFQTKTMPLVCPNRVLFACQKKHCTEMGCCLSSETCEVETAPSSIKENERLHREIVALRGSIQDDPTYRRFECKICFDSLVATVFLPCGHCMTCRECGMKFSHCPLCEAPIQNLADLMFP